MWIASDPDDRRRRTAFGSEQAARGFAEQMEPSWTVKPANDPSLPAMTGRRVDEAPPGKVHGAPLVPTVVQPAVDSPDTDRL